MIVAIAVVWSAYGIAQTEVYNEDFQSGLPVAYTIVDNDGLTPDASVSDFAPAWHALVDPDDASQMDTVVGSTSFFSPAGRADRWLITPAITLGAYGNILYWEARSHDPSYLDGYDVYISTTDTQLSSFTDTLTMVILENATWTSRSVNMSEAGYNNQTVHLAFVNRTNDGFKLYLDDIRVVIEDPVGIEEASMVSLSVYPNPSSDLIKVQADQLVTELKLISFDGKMVMTTDQSELNVSGFNPGVYQLMITTEAGTFVRRVVIQ